MPDDRIAGTAKNLGGKVQESFGSMTGNRSQEAKGKLNQAEGALQDMYGQAKDAPRTSLPMLTISCATWLRLGRTPWRSQRWPLASFSDEWPAVKSLRRSTVQEVG